jgi:hypothetical protein
LRLPCSFVLKIIIISSFLISLRRINALFINEQLKDENVKVRQAGYLSKNPLQPSSCAIRLAKTKISE